jgi:hypothetical protein
LFMARKQTAWKSPASKSNRKPSIAGTSKTGLSAGSRFAHLSKKPLGLPTRGKTAPNRLRPTDTYLALCYSGFLERLPGAYLDLGFGQSPSTTVETAARLRRINPGMRIVGVEIDPERVAAAQPWSGLGMDFRLGGFNLPLREGERAAVIRAMNVLRQYPESEYTRAITVLADFLPEEGLLLEGTSDPSGRLMAFNVYRRAGEALAFDGLVFSVRLRRPFEPRSLQAVLPKNHIHHAEPGSPLDLFFGDWEKCWKRARGRSADDPRLIFSLAARLLASERGHSVDTRSILLRRGFLRLKSLPGE